MAFLIPLLERLYLERWGPMDGLGAVVLSPTRELAIQTFNALRSIGGHHTFSAGLVIGGKSLKDEQDRLQRMNILIATPGRLLQHFDSTVGLETGGVKVLVLDEADRLLDLGFLPTLRAIIQHITPGGGSAAPTAVSVSATATAGGGDERQKSQGRPQGRQTLLFSATQSPNLVHLAKLSLNSPITIDVDQHLHSGSDNLDPSNTNTNTNGNSNSNATIMPAGLEQYYTTIPLDRKLDALWGFVKSHLKMKGVVFVSSCKQVSLGSGGRCLRKVEEGKRGLNFVALAPGSTSLASLALLATGPIHLRNLPPSSPRPPPHAPARETKTTHPVGHLPTVLSIHRRPPRMHGHCLPGSRFPSGRLGHPVGLPRGRGHVHP